MRGCICHGFEYVTVVAYWLGACSRRRTPGSPQPATGLWSCLAGTGDTEDPPSIRLSVRVDGHSVRRGRGFAPRKREKKAGGCNRRLGPGQPRGKQVHRLARVAAGCIRGVARQMRRRASCSARSRIHAGVVLSDGTGRGELVRGSTRVRGRCILGGARGPSPRWSSPSFARIRGAMLAWEDITGLVVFLPEPMVRFWG